MNTSRELLLTDIYVFLKRTGQSQSGFGRDVMGDPSFITALENGRCPTSRTIEFVRKHISGGP